MGHPTRERKFPLIKLAKKLKDKFLEANPSKEEEQFPLIKLAKKLKVFVFYQKKGNHMSKSQFPLIKLAKKLKEVCV